MKPGFALSLSQDGIRLYQRTASGWARVGEVDPETPALSESMAQLRQTAAGLSPEGFQTKLVLPESQILYADIDAPGPDRASRRAQIAKALEGRTPYPVRDLVFDWSGAGPKVKVAVVARITLDEAEAFAEDHRFHPVSFVASPEPGQFDGEPFFGTTGRVIAYLPPGERLERDGEPIGTIVAPGAVAPLAAVATAAGAVEDDDAAPFVAIEDDAADDAPGDAEGAEATAGAGAEDAQAEGLTAKADAVLRPEEPDSATVTVDDGLPADDAAPAAVEAADAAGIDAAPETPVLVGEASAGRETAEMVGEGAAAPSDTATDPARETEADAGPVASATADAAVADATPVAEATQRDSANEPARDSSGTDQASALQADTAPVAEETAKAATEAPPPQDQSEPAGHDHAEAAPIPEPETAAAGAGPADPDSERPVAAAPADETAAPADEAAADPAPPVPHDAVPDDAVPDDAVPDDATPDEASDRPEPDARPIPVIAAEVAVTTAEPSIVPAAAFTSRRRKGNGPPLTEPPLTGTGPRLEAVLSAARPPRKPNGGVGEPPLRGASAFAADAAGSLVRPEVPVTTRTKPVAPPRREGAAKPGKARGAGAALIRALARSRTDEAARKPVLRHKPKPPEAEAEELTVFGRRRRNAEGQPRRLGVMLTAALVAVMAAVAFWSVLFDGGDPTTEVAEAPAVSEPVAPAVPADEPAPQSETALASETPADQPEPDLPASDQTAADLPAADGATEDLPAAEADVPTATAEAAPPADEPAADAGAAGTDVAAADTAVAATEQDAATGADPAAPVARPTSDVEAAIAAAAASTAGTEALVAAAPPASSGPLPVPDTLTRYGTEGLWDSAPLPGTLPAPDAEGAPVVAAAPLGPSAPSVSPPEGDGVARDTAPEALPVPVPYAQLVRLGPDGLVIATPEGVVSPEGVTIYAARPPNAPGQRPADLVPPAPEPVAPVATAAPDAAAPGTAGEQPPADGTLATGETAAPEAVPVTGAPPLPRPVTNGALETPEPAIAQTGEAAPAPAVSPAPAQRPTARPEALAAAAAAAAAQTPAEPVAQTAPEGPPSALAVAASARPTAKPDRANAAINAAVVAAVNEPIEAAVAAAAAPAPEPEPQQEVSAAAPVAEEIDEPEPTSTASAGNTRASVAKQATIRNALDLSDVNLIGVFGSSNDRRALVRMSSGRFVRVKVGDRLDGGKVAAIGDTQLTYVKNGRTITLKMIRDS